MIKFISTLLVLSGFMGLMAQENPWVVPDDQKEKTAPIMFSPEMSEAGGQIYQKNCFSCHGNPTEDNMNKFLKPLPSDLGSQKVADETDGEIYYKIVAGRGTMPSFKNVLSSADTWNVIAYIRSFHKNYVQPEPRVAETFTGTAVKLTMEFLQEDKKFKVVAMGKEKGNEVPAEGVEISLFTKRYFGLMKLGDNKSTNKDGIAKFDVPANLPGDAEGKLELIAKVVDTEQYGEGKAEAVFLAGVENNKPSLTEKRAMWNVSKKAPWWITLAYPLAVLSVLATLGYIASLVRKIFILGKE